jgi:hypothetical protein
MSLPAEPRLSSGHDGAKLATSNDPNARAHSVPRHRDCTVSDRPSIHYLERGSPMRNRKREICTSGPKPLILLQAPPQTVQQMSVCFSARGAVGQFPQHAMRPASTNPDAHPLSSSADRPADVLASETIRAMHLSRMRPAPEFARAQLAGGIGAEGTANAEKYETGWRHSGLMELLSRICGISRDGRTIAPPFREPRTPPFHSG